MWITLSQALNFLTLKPSCTCSYWSFCGQKICQGCQMLLNEKTSSSQTMSRQARPGEEKRLVAVTEKNEATMSCRETEAR